MAGLQDNKHPPGFRFHPTDQELIVHYLKKKVMTSSVTPPLTSIIADVDLYKFNPWDLPAKASFGEGEWFFYSPRDRKYPNGARPNRATGAGYWKATGTDKPIMADDGSHCLGVKKALVFYKGRPPKGVKTDWVMHEYRLLDSASLKYSKGSMRLDDWVLCRVRQKSSISRQTKDVDAGDAATPEIAGGEVAADVRPAFPPATARRDLMALLEGSCNDYQSIAAYLLGSQYEEAGGLHVVHDMTTTTTTNNNNNNNGYGIQLQCAEQPIYQVFDVMNKRQLSFGNLHDEFFSRPPPSKKMNFSGGGDYYCLADADRLSPALSDSDDQASPGFSKLD